ncbi:hypothetical protein D1627_08415 [Pontibacter oryzae]|uniref:Uncharacterized protein n=1 Tax=Pontibacter oryzae TaxID=2304593 RepID=A0A399SIR5_9BACT|nr:hypothetical protein D1627_08415 [Pontibacter oryzae]
MVGLIIIHVSVYATTNLQLSLLTISFIYHIIDKKNNFLYLSISIKIDTCSIFKYKALIKKESITLD